MRPPDESNGPRGGFQDGEYEAGGPETPPPYPPRWDKDPYPPEDTPPDDFESEDLPPEEYDDEEGEAALYAPVAREHAPFFNYIVYGFIFLAVIGGVLLIFPFASADGGFTSPVDAFFTATSAVSATGLVAVDTGDHWSRTGQAVIMVLIQIGGLGYMTIGAFLLLMVRGRIDMGDDMVSETLGSASTGKFLLFVAWVLGITLLIEAAGIIVISSRFAASFSDKSTFDSIFYGVSAFNNAGFDLEGGMRGITSFQRDTQLLGAISALFIIGGLGVPMVTVLLTRLPWVQWTLDSKMAIVSSLALVALGAVAIGSFETAASFTQGGEALGGEALNSFFISASARTAGFTTIDIGGLTVQTLLLIMALMFVGGVSGSTAGGIKINTFATLFATAVSYLRGYKRVHAFGKVLPETQVHRAIAIVFLGVVIVFLFILIMSALEPFDFIPVAFETVSAFSTTGFSTGITPDLSAGGKIMLIFAMFIGRLGPLTVVLALARHRGASEEIEAEEEAIRIG